VSDLELLVALCDYVMLTSGPSSMSEDGTTAYLSLDALTDDDLLDEHAARLLWLRLAHDALMVEPGVPGR